MNRKLLAALAVIPLILTACSASGEKTSEAASVTNAPSAEPIILDELTGMTVAEATTFLNASGLSPQFEYDIEDETIPNNVIQQSSGTFEVTNYSEPESGATTIAVTATPDEDFINAHMAFKTTCQGEPGDEVIMDDFWSLSSIWKSELYKQYVSCETTVDSDSWEPDAKQRKAIAVMNEWSTFGSVPDANAIETATAICAVPPNDPDQEWANVDLAEIKAAAVLCEDAPFHAALQGWADEKRFSGDIFDVPEDLDAGTYETVRKVNECNWYHMDSEGEFYERKTSSGPQKLSVNLKNGDTFFADIDCGIWAKK